MIYDATCSCGENTFQLRLLRDEQVGLVTCAVGHSSLLLDSGDYWADLLQDGRPKVSQCRCRNRLFRLKMHYVFRDTGDVRSVEAQFPCAVCGLHQKPMSFEFKYSPTDSLVSRPLVRIERPWEQPRRVEFTAYWRPEDAQRFAAHLIQKLGAEMHYAPYGGTPKLRALEEAQFLPELRANLYFTNMTGLKLTEDPDPQRDLPVLALSGPTHMLFGFTDDLLDSSEIYLLHYVKFAVETVIDGRITTQPENFLRFTQDATAWLTHNYASNRGKYSADNPAEYLRLKPHLRAR